MFFAGLDLSLNHWAMVSVTEGGGLHSVTFQPDKRKFLRAGLGSGLYRQFGEGFINALEPPLIEKEADLDVRASKRLYSIFLAIKNELIPRYYHMTRQLAIESAAYSLRSRSLSQLNEVLGIAKCMFLESGFELRLHDPLSTKLFSTGDGQATKRNVVDYFLQFVPADVHEYMISNLVVEGKDDIDGPITDIADAFCLARMLMLEQSLRAGKISMGHLTEGERRVFNRVTKANPVNVLERDLISRDLMMRVDGDDKVNSTKKLSEP